MRHSTRRTLAAAAAAAAGLGLLGSTAAAATPTPDGPAAAATWNSTGATWNDPNDAGGVSVYERASKLSTGEDILGQFIAYGEKISVFDRHDNDRKAIVKLWVGGSGPAVFYGNGDGTERVSNESYGEGQAVYLQVCTSDSANAVCSDRTHRGRS